MIKVGGEVDALCTRCELTLAHTVIALVGGHPVKVECNTCHGVHRYREETAATKPGHVTVGRRERKRVVSFDQLLQQRKVSTAPRYSPHATYVVNQVVDHPTFGLGFVSAIRDAGKIEVTFRTEVKTLIHGKR